MPAALTVIIPTYNRYDDLTVCIKSILQQSRLPDELIIIDDAQLPHVPLQAECEQRGIKVVYDKKDHPGLTASRNRGIALATGELLYFLDDDVELFPQYLENIARVFDQDKAGEIGGVGGVIVNDPPLTRSKKVRRLFDLCFMITGPVEGKVLPSGFCVNFGASGKAFDGLTAVDFLAGGVCAYRREVFIRQLFDENYQGYGLGEDKDFSYRLSHYYKLVITPDAQLNHYESVKMRFDKARLGFEFVLSRYRFFKTHVYRGPLSNIPFYYALFGYTLARTIITCLSFKATEFQRLKGIFSGIGHLLSGKAKQALLNEASHS